MSQLQDNLKLGLEAVKYAKAQIKRSANQHYFKSKSPFKQSKQNDFLLGASRGGSYAAYSDTVTGDFVDMDKDPEMAGRRKILAQLIAQPMDKKEKRKKINSLMKLWGKNYFQQGQTIFDHPKGKQSAWGAMSANDKVTKVAKVLNKNSDDVGDMWNDNDQSQWDFVFDVFVTKMSADNARKYGVGNCQEKGELATLYLLDQTPGGVRLALYALEEEHKGLTGLITGAGGDHVFAVYGHDAVTDRIGSLGPNAIIVDGWMNDAYPAQEYLKPKHGLNYNNERINVKQFTTRNMVCVSYRNHIECMRDFGTPPAGPRAMTAPQLVRTSF